MITRRAVALSGSTGADQRLRHGLGEHKLTMAARIRWTGTTQQRGYGHQHQQLRRRLLLRWKPGDLCTRCGRPMWDQRYIDLAHTPDRAAYEGLQHRACNRGEGASRGNRMRGRVWRHARRW